MICPTDGDWTLVSMDLLDEDRTDWMREHLQGCQHCRARFSEMRRDHVGLLRAYEAMDRFHDFQREQLLVSLPVGVPKPASSGWVSRRWRRLGDLIMDHPKVRRTAGLLSAAAVIALVVPTFLGSGDGVAFANVIERLREIRTLACRIVSNTTAYGQNIAVTGKMYMSSDYGTRCDFNVFGQASTTLYRPLDGPMVVVTPMTRSYMVIEGEDEDASFDHMRDPDAFLKKLTELSEDASEVLGSDFIDGHEVVGFEIAAEQLELDGVEASATLHVDVETALPVQFALKMAGPEPGSLINVLYDKFEWDMVLEAELFEPVIPEGYAKVSVQLPPKDEETLIEALAIYAELTGGRYPDEFDAMQMVTKVARLVAEQIVADGQLPTPGSAAYDTLNQKVMQVGSACDFYHRLVRDGMEPEYFGHQVTADDTDAVLMKWRLDKRYIRQVYGDLSVETVQDW